MSQETIIQNDVRQRIFTAADKLYLLSNPKKHATHYAVRSEAQVDMNSVSIYYKEWKHNQTVQAKQVCVVTIPEPVKVAHDAAVVQLWDQATTFANQSLMTAQTGWELERREMDDARAEIAAAFDATLAELELIKAQLVSVTSELNLERQRHKDTATSDAQQITELRNQLNTAQTEAANASSRTVEIEHRVQDLKVTLAEIKSAAIFELEAERQRHACSVEAAATSYKAQAERLDEAIADSAATKATAAAAEHSHADQRKVAAAEAQRTADQMSKLGAELNEARATAATAREEAARLHGSTEAMQTQIADLLRVLAMAKPAA